MSRCICASASSKPSSSACCSMAFCAISSACWRIASNCAVSAAFNCAAVGAVSDVAVCSSSACPMGDVAHVESTFSMATGKRPPSATAALYACTASGPAASPSSSASCSSVLPDSWFSRASSPASTQNSRTGAPVSAVARRTTSANSAGAPFTGACSARLAMMATWLGLVTPAREVDTASSAVEATVPAPVTTPPPKRPACPSMSACSGSYMGPRCSRSSFSDLAAYSTTWSAVDCRASVTPSVSAPSAHALPRAATRRRKSGSLVSNLRTCAFSASAPGASCASVPRFSRYAATTP